MVNESNKLGNALIIAIQSKIWVSNLQYLIMFQGHLTINVVSTVGSLLLLI